MDIQMPIVDGYEATNLISSHEKDHKGIRTPIIAMTAHAIKGYREKYFNAGMDDFTSKPLKKKNFRALVNKWATDYDKNIGLAMKFKQQSPVFEGISEKPDSVLDIPTAYEEFGNDFALFNDIFLQFIDAVKIKLR
jgi:two-component system, sensor histidine kinase and response regulator